MVYVEVPRLVVAGWSALLRCQFDLEGEKLYSVKWYTSNLEFFRYTPDRSPSTVAFPVPGLNVDLSGSNMNEVRLRNVATNMSALFFCEVSADGPTFHTATESAFLNVSDISIRKPQLLISSSVYSRDMYINCSAQETDPPPKVTFFLDEQPVRVFFFNFRKR
ncbi:hypothetical protein AAG570_012315 [Ranatra chinensis]|uniref:Ig-like domain-containing protein n=1 Tax=Ranatra chinensis TaxID=642074 RepID=A0ABD0Z4R5_9HEMI